MHTLKQEHALRAWNNKEASVATAEISRQKPEGRDKSCRALERFVKSLYFFPLSEMTRH